MTAPLRLSPRDHMRGTLRVPGDKSISHRSLLFAALARGASRVRGLSPGEDVRSTRRALEALGVTTRDEGGAVVVFGRGWDGLDRDPGQDPLTIDCGNSGTTARLLLGLLAGRRGRYRLVGDASLSRRPMARVAEPLRRMGARIEGGDTLPLVVEGAPLRALDFDSPVASAQIKSALVLAGLQAEGSARLTEPTLSRDHTERMLAPMGAPLRRRTDGQGRPEVLVEGGCHELRAIDFDVPGDPSSAAYAIALACLLPESDVRVAAVSLNPTRTGFYRLLARMGADLRSEVASETGEPQGTLRVRTSALRGIDVGEADVVDAIDEIPLLACVAARAEGTTRITGAGELRVKESDRIRETVGLLRAFDVDAEEVSDGILVRGPWPIAPANVDAKHDHRIGMCAAVLASLAHGESELTGAEWIAISYPGFFEDLDQLSR